MKKETADKLYKEIRDEWIERHGRDKLDPEKMNAIKEMLYLVPDEDGNKRITSMETGKTHLVPIKEMILNGLNGKELDKYPVLDEVDKND